MLVRNHTPAVIQTAAKTASQTGNVRMIEIATKRNPTWPIMTPAERQITPTMLE